MPFDTLRMDGTYRGAVYSTVLLTLPLLDVSQVTYRDPVDVTGAVSDDEAIGADPQPTPADHARQVMEALGGPVPMEAEDKRAFGRLLADHTEPVDVAHEIDEAPQRGF